jgi:membrane protease YdiL (CAAX protease family)
LQLPDSISPHDPPASPIQHFPSAPVADPAWNLFDVLLIVIFTFFSLLIVLGLTLGVAHSLPRFHQLKPVDLAQNALLLVSAQTVAYLLVVAFMVQIVRLKGRDDFLAAVSWNWPPPEQAFRALASGAGLAVLSSIFTFFLSRWIPKSLPIDKFFHDTSSAYVLALFGVLVAPFVEELFFRGFLYPALVRPIGVGTSVVLTAASFAVVHQGQLAHAWVPLAWLFIVGVVLTVVRARTKSVATCVLIHLAYNATLFSFFFVASHGFHQLDTP